MLSVAFVCEARADFELVSALLDRQVCESCAWVEMEWLDSIRKWVIVGDFGEQFLKWAAIRRGGFGVRRFLGFVEGHSTMPDALPAVRAMDLLVKHEPDVIVLLRDQDDQPSRRTGLEQARTTYSREYPDVTVVIGFAIVERESWVLSGLLPVDDEVSLLSQLRKELGFDPTRQSERLDACKNDQAVKSPKRVLNCLTANNQRREERCWRETRLSTLAANGANNGLKSYLEEVRQLIVPRISGAST